MAWRWHEQKLHCFLVPKKTVKCFESFLAEGSYPPGCLAVEPREILFVQAEPPYDTIDTLTVGTSFRVKLVFDADPGQTTAPVTVTNERTGKTIELVAEQTEDPTIFRTPPVNLLPEVTP